MAWVLFAQQNTIKTAFWFSRINFYFVTSFYLLYDICMARYQKTFVEYVTINPQGVWDKEDGTANLILCIIINSFICSFLIGYVTLSQYPKISMMGRMEETSNIYCMANQYLTIPPTVYSLTPFIWSNEYLETPIIWRKYWLISTILYCLKFGSKE